MKENTAYLVIGSSSAKTRTGGDYCSLKLKNLAEEGSVNVWDVSPNDRPKIGELVSFSGLQEREGKFSANKRDLQPDGLAQPGHPLYDLLPRPISREQWDACISHLQALSQDATLRNLIGELAEKFFAPYAARPAAKSMHHAFPGGLLNHTYQMLRMLEGIHDSLPYPVRVDYCALAILFHDYGKGYEYEKNGDIREEMPLLGHIYISAKKLHDELKKKEVAEAEINHIVHIVLSHHGTHEFGSPVLPATKEAILVHALDNLSAKMDAHEGTPPMERCHALDTNAVK